MNRKAKILTSAGRSDLARRIDRDRHKNVRAEIGELVGNVPGDICYSNDSRNKIRTLVFDGLAWRVFEYSSISYSVSYSQTDSVAYWIYSVVA